MKLNRIEKTLMHNPGRQLWQFRLEAALLERLGGRTKGKRILEVGCGGGVGVETLFERFEAAHVTALDLNPDMVKRARRRLSRYPPHRLELFVGDVTAVQVASESFDAVFDFGILHHVPIWQGGVSEIRRVLRPGGRFFFEEVTDRALRRWSYRTFLDHPSKNRLSRTGFIGELERQGMGGGENVTSWFFGDFFLGVGHRQDPSPDLQGRAK